MGETVLDACLMAPSAAIRKRTLSKEVDFDEHVDDTRSSTASVTAIVSEPPGQGPICSSCGLRHGLRHNGKALEAPPGIFCQGPERQGWLESAFCIVTLGLVCGMFYIIIPVQVFLILHALVHRSVCTGTLAALLFSSMWWPLDNRFPWPAFSQCYLFRAWRRYFAMECIVTEALEPGRRYMLAESPHGIVPLGQQLLSATVCQHTYPGVGQMAGVAADIVMWIPVIRQLYGWLGTRCAGRGTIASMYRDGVNVAVVLGGIAEMFLVSTEEERVYLKNRKGFVRMAVMQGADVVPLFFFGNSSLFTLVGGGDGSLLLSISRRIKSSLLVFHGRFGLTVPYRRPLRMVSGRPIHVQQTDDPSQEYIDSIHQELVERTVELYETYRPAWETRPLKIY
ncbi:unnamed protein product [Phaeothamnion confervicola]